MPTLPLLKTGAVVQYPARREVRYANQVVRYLDGSEQRYRELGAALRRWVIRLDLLDEGELAALEEFFASQQGEAGSFSFVDPWDSVEYPDCSFADERLDMELTGEMRGRTRLTIRQNRV